MANFNIFFVEFHMRLVASFVKDAVVRKDDAKSYVEKSRRVVDTEILSLIILGVLLLLL